MPRASCCWSGILYDSKSAKVQSTTPDVSVGHDTIYKRDMHVLLDASDATLFDENVHLCWKFMSSPSRPPSQRLLYRGALSLPDSYLLLDGLTFSAKIDAEHNLLENPLALALESMRGRPTLRFMGVASLKDIHIDDSGDITL